MRMNLLNNRSGMIMLLAITFILMMSVVMAGLFSRDISAALTLLARSKEIRSEMLARGKFWQTYDQLMLNNTVPANGVEVMDGISYTYSINRNTAASPNVITVTVTYPD